MDGAAPPASPQVSIRNCAFGHDGLDVSVADEQLPTRITQWRADDAADIDGFDHDALDAPDEMLTLTQYAQRATILHDHGSLGCSDRDDVELIDRHERTRR